MNQDNQGMAPEEARAKLGFGEVPGRESPQPASERIDPVSRRAVLKLTGASLALAGIAGCTKKPDEPIHPSAKETRPSILMPKDMDWPKDFGFVQGRDVPAGARTIYVAGQASMDAAGKVLHKGDMEAQVMQAFKYVEKVVAEAGGDLSNVIKVTYFTTDIERFFVANTALTKYLAQHNCHPTSTLVEVKRLALPDLLFEVESIAVI